MEEHIIRICKSLHIPRVPPIYEQRELSVPEPSITRLSAFVHAPSFDHINPASDELFVAFDYEIEKVASEDVCGEEDAVVGAVLDCTVVGEAVEDEGGADGLFGEGVEPHGRGVGGWGG